MRDGSAGYELNGMTGSDFLPIPCLLNLVSPHSFYSCSGALVNSQWMTIPKNLPCANLAAASLVTLSLITCAPNATRSIRKQAKPNKADQVAYKRACLASLETHSFVIQTDAPATLTSSSPQTKDIQETSQPKQEHQQPLNATPASPKAQPQPQPQPQPPAAPSAPHSIGSGTITASPLVLEETLSTPVSRKHSRSPSPTADDRKPATAGATPVSTPPSSSDRPIQTNKGRCFKCRVKVIKIGLPIDRLLTCNMCPSKNNQPINLSINQSMPDRRYRWRNKPLTNVDATMSFATRIDILTDTTVRSTLASWIEVKTKLKKKIKIQNAQPPPLSLSLSFTLHVILSGLANLSN